MKELFAILTLAVYLSGILAPIPAFAGTSSLYLTPSSNSQNVGNNFNIYLGVNANGNAVNAFQATVNLPLSIVSINSASSGGSLCSIWVQQPTVSGSTVSFSCGVPGGTTASGNLISISLKATAIGSATASISGAKVLAGPGTNVTGGTSGATINVVAAPGGGTTPGGSTGPGATVSQSTNGPKVSSSSHPDQNAWYKNRDIALSWTRDNGVTGYSYAFDQNPGSVPPSFANTNNNSISFNVKEDGVWYFHIRANGPNGWGDTTHFRLQIDNAPPKNLVLSSDPSGVSDRRPVITFSATDELSGIDYYEIRLDGGEFKRATSPYTPERISSGDHTFTVRAYDKSGNMTEGDIKVKIKEIPSPKILTPADGTIFKLMNQLFIKGTATPSTKVDLYLNGKRIAQGLDVDQNGNWQYTYNSFIFPGSYKLTAVAVNDGIESKSSEIVDFSVDPSAITIFGINIPSALIFLFLLGTIGVLIIIILYLLHLVRKKVRARYAKSSDKSQPSKPETKKPNNKISPDTKKTSKKNKK